MHLSKRAGVQRSNVQNIGVTTTTRMYWRSYYTQNSVPGMLGDNDFVNEAIAGDFAGAAPLHRFWLKSGEPAEIRQSHAFFYIAAIRGTGQYDIITIQARYTAPTDQQHSTYTLTQPWLEQSKKRKE